VFGAESSEQCLSRTLDVYPAQKFMNDNLPIDTKVAFYGDTRGFYLDRRYVWADPGHNAQFTRRYADEAEFVRYLKSAGVTHAMVNLRFLPPPWAARGTARFVYQAIRSGRFKQVYPACDDGRGVAVFEVR
jgi:hypothetical protein